MSYFLVAVGIIALVAAVLFVVGSAVAMFQFWRDR